MDATYASLDDTFSSMENLYEHLLPLLPSRGRLIDVGCGIGVLLRRIQERHPKLKGFGVDFSPVAVERTRGYGFEAELAVLPDVPYPNDYFDGLTCTEVLEHLDDPLTAVRTFHRLLKPGGRLVVSVPRGVGPNYCDQHVQDFTPETLAECLTRGGFHVESIEPIVREPERCDAASFLALATKPVLEHEYSAEYYVRRPMHPMWRVEAKLMRSLVGPAREGTVVDVGCGAGDLLSFLAPTKGIGIDANPTAVQLAAARFGQYEFHQSDAAELGAADGSVDCVVSMHLIEHVTRPEQVLAAWRQALRPGGKIVITTPNARFSHPETFDDPDHKHIFTGPELIELVGSAGFRVERALSVGLWGVRRWPLLWRCQGPFNHIRTSGRWPMRWRGQSLVISAAREAD